MICSSPWFALLTTPAYSLLALATTAVAQDQVAASEEEDPGALWEWRIAAFARYGPSYPASEESQVNVVPLPIPIYRGRFLRLFEDSENPIRGKVFERDRIKLDLDFDLTFGSDSDDIDARTGMPDLDFLAPGRPGTGPAVHSPGLPEGPLAPRAADPRRGVIRRPRPVVARPDVQ